MYHSGVSRYLGIAIYVLVVLTDRHASLLMSDILIRALCVLWQGQLHDRVRAAHRLQSCGILVLVILIGGAKSHQVASKTVFDTRSKRGHHAIVGRKKQLLINVVGNDIARISRKSCLIVLLLQTPHIVYQIGCFLKALHRYLSAISFRFFICTIA